MRNVRSQGMLALMITIAAGVIDAGGSTSQAGSCFKTSGGHIIYVCPLPPPPPVYPKLITLHVTAGPNSGVGSNEGADNVYITATAPGENLSGPDLVLDNCMSRATGSSLPSDVTSPWLTGCFLNGNFKIPCGQTGTLSISFIGGSLATNVPLSYPATITRNCSAWHYQLQNIRRRR